MMMRVVLLLCLLSLVGCGPITFTIGSSPADREIESTVVQEARAMTANRVAIIDITGMDSEKGRLGKRDKDIYWC